MTRDDAAVSGTVNAILVLAALSSFFVTVQLNWIPVWVGNQEAAQASALAAAVGAWAGEAEALAGRQLLNRSFGVALPVGSAGLPVLGAGASSGVAALDTGPSLAVTVAGAPGPPATAEGSLRAASGTTRYPAQEHRYALGALELRQGDRSWVDLRRLLRVEREAGGALSLSLQVMSVAGGPGQAASTREVQVAGFLAKADARSMPGGDVRLVAAGVAGDAWRAALQRQFDAAGLPGETLPDCAASTRAWCLRAGGNGPDALDLTLRNVAPGWGLSTGMVRAELRP